MVAKRLQRLSGTSEYSIRIEHNSEYRRLEVRGTRRSTRKGYGRGTGGGEPVRESGSEGQEWKQGWVGGDSVRNREKRRGQLGLTPESGRCRSIGNSEAGAGHSVGGIRQAVECRQLQVAH